MKKVISWMLALLMLVSMCACTAKQPTEEQANAKAGEETKKASQQSDQKVYTFYVCHADNDGTIVDLATEKWAELAKEASDGRLILELYPGSQMGNPQDVLDSAIAGDNVISIGQGGYYADLGVNEFDATFAPYLFESWDDFDKLIKSDWYQGKLSELENNIGLKVISLGWHYGVRQTMSTFEIHHLSDIAGKKVRLPGVSAQVIGYRCMGATTVTMGMTEVYTALQQGAIDACENQLFGLYSNGFYEVAPYLTMTNHCYVDCNWCMNAEVFKALPEDLQQILVSTGEQARDYYNENIEKIEAEALQNLLDAGVICNEIDYEEFSSVTPKFFEAEEHASWDPALYEKLRAAIDG